jgi:hypothetical protein
MPPLPLPAWLAVLAETHFGFVCAAVFCVATFFVVLFEKTLINSGQFGRNCLAFICVIIANSGLFLCIAIYFSAYKLGPRQPVPATAKHYIYGGAMITIFIALVLAAKDKKD